MLKKSRKLNRLLAPVIVGVLVAFLFIAAQVLFLKFRQPESKPAVPAVSPQITFSHAGEFRQKENAYELSPEYLPLDRDPGPVHQMASPSLTALPGRPKAELTPEPENKHLNTQSNNLNVLFLGVDGDKLLMCSLYSINYRDKMQSGAVFTPTFSLVPGESYTFAQLYRREGVSGVKKVLEKEMEVHIAYHILIQRAVFDEIEKFIDPIYIDGEKVNLADLFTMKVGPKDQEILGALMREFTKPGTFFIDLPRLIFSAKKYVSTDFKINPKNLMLHYKIARGVDTTKITKVILPGRTKLIGGQKHYELLTYPLQNTIYEITR